MNAVGLSTFDTSSVSNEPVLQTPVPRNNSAIADEVVDLFRQGRQAEAVNALNSARQGQPQAIQDALDRMVSTRLGASLRPDFLAPTPVFQVRDIADTLRRINQAGNAAPAMPDVSGLTEAQKFDVYSSIVATRGNQAAHTGLANGDRVILGMRAEDSSMANRGQGLYNDRVVVLSRGADGVPHVEEFNRANTEPTAQYDGNQRTNRNLAAFRRAEGMDVTGDRIPELGRLGEGTTELIQTTHHNPPLAGTNFSLRPSATAVAGGADRVERDTNHDTFFNQNDPNRTTALNNTFKIHSGSLRNTDSAGCTTIHPNDFARFQGAVTADPAQTRWQYVLTTTQ